MKSFNFCFSFMLLMMGLGLRAEIVYTPTGLSIDALYEHSIPADLSIGLPRGLILKGYDPDQVFKIYFPSSGDLTFPSPAISGNGVISFYDPLYACKISIKTRRSFEKREPTLQLNLQDTYEANYTDTTDIIVFTVVGRNKVPYIFEPTTFKTLHIREREIDVSKEYWADEVIIGENVTVKSGVKLIIHAKNTIKMLDTTMS